MSDQDPLLGEQVAYYRARAPWYDQWFRREGIHDLGPELNAAFMAEVDAVRAALDAFAPKGEVLELAAGTGEWTRLLARHADRITAVDASPEVLDINRSKLEPGTAPVEHVVADLFSWRPDREYDAVFFGFWLTHVPPERFDAFWGLVHDALRPGGRFFVVDNALPRPDAFAGEPAKVEWTPTTVTTPTTSTDLVGGTAVRTLEDGRTFRIVKVYYRPDDLERRLSALGWTSRFQETPRFFLYGSGSHP